MNKADITKFGSKASRQLFPVSLYYRSLTHELIRKNSAKAPGLNDRKWVRIA